MQNRIIKQLDIAIQYGMMVSRFKELTEHGRKALLLVAVSYKVLKVNFKFTA